MSTLALPQARIPLGYAMVSGQRVPVEIDAQWMRAFLGLLDRTGGTTGTGGTVSNVDEVMGLLLSLPQDLAAQEAIRAVDELRNELASTRTDAQTLRSKVDELESQIASMRAYA
jgi:hypothetical protein